MLRYQSDVVSRLEPWQLGVGSRLGAEAIIHKTRCWTTSSPPDHVILQLDFRNAFNCLSRASMLEQIAKTCPMFSRYATACYSNPATLYANGFQLTSEDGEHQGCPCGPLFFAVTALDLAKFADGASSDTWSRWYLDDGYIAGPRTALNDLLPALEQRAAVLGLQLNRPKCRVLLPSDWPLPPGLFPGIPVCTPSDVFPVLGSPVGDPAACKEWVSQHVLGPYELALGRLQNLGDPRAASLILRQCLSACKVSWVLRTAAPEVACWAASKASPLLRQAWSTVVGVDVPDMNWRLASLPIREGGAGIADPLDLVEAALVSSWLSAATRSPATSCVGHPAGMEEAIQALAAKCPNLGTPLMAALNHNGIAAARQHQLLPHWCSQGTWSDESFKNAIKEFDASVHERTR